MPAHSYTVPLRKRIFRFFARPAFRALFHLLSQVHIEGIENIPQQGPYLVAINHVSLYDPPFVVSCWPRALEAVGAVEIWSRAGQSTLVNWYGGIQVHRGQLDRESIESMLAAVSAGYPLLIAPEGGRSHTPGLRRGFPGVAYIVHKHPMPVVPVGIVGTTEDFWQRAKNAFPSRRNRPELELHIGPPLTLPVIEAKGTERKEALQQNVDLIMTHIAALLPEAYRGCYGGSEVEKIAL